MTFIDDNGNQLEFGGAFAMTKQAVSFFNGSIKGDVSINFEVDNNSVNRKVLNYYGPQMTGQVAWTKQAFNRVRNGNILDRGYIVIQSETEDSLSCFYVSGNSNWVQLLNTLITELDYSGLTGVKNHYFLADQSNISLTASSTTGIVFPFCDYIYNYNKGYSWASTAFGPTLLWPVQSTTKSLIDESLNFINKPVWAVYPSFYLSSLIDEIGSQNDVKFTGSVFTDQIYKTLAITASNGLMKRNVPKKITLAGSSQSFTGTGNFKYNSFTVLSDNLNQWDSVNKRYVSGYYTGLVFTFNVRTKSSTNIQQIKIYKNGVSVNGFQSPFYAGEILNNLSSSSPVIIPVAPTDVIEIYILCAAAAADTLTLDLTISESENISYGEYIEPSSFLPALSCLDVIKFIINYFGCATYYNEYSRTITCNIIEKIKTESAYDWSEYYLSHRSDYTVNQAKNNYINLADNNSDNSINKYNSSHSLKYGSANIETTNTLKDKNTLAEIKFSPSGFNYMNNIGTYFTNIPLVNLVDSTSIEFTAIADATLGVVNLTVADGLIFSQGEIVRITTSSNGDLGYFEVFTPSVFGIQVYFTFYGTDTGYIRKQSANYNNVGARIITIRTSTTTAELGLSVTHIGGSLSPKPSIAYGVFSKSFTSFPIDQWKNNLAIDNPDSGGFTDPTIKQLYFNKISKFLQNPNIRAKMLLPESVYQSFVFDQFIYLRTENLTGYFFVDSIVNYIDGNTPCEVNLYML